MGNNSLESPHGGLSSDTTLFGTILRLDRSLGPFRGFTNKNNEGASTLLGGPWFYLFWPLETPGGPRGISWATWGDIGWAIARWKAFMEGFPVIPHFLGPFCSWADLWNHSGASQTKTRGQRQHFCGVEAPRLFSSVCISGQQGRRDGGGRCL